MTLLHIKNLHVSVEGKEVLKGVDLTLEKGKIYALLGPNGSGKSTLSHTIMGHPQCKITKGNILYNGQDLTSLAVHQRAQAGIFLGFQYPRSITGVSAGSFLRTAINAVRHKKLSILEAQAFIEEQCTRLNIDKSFLSRSLNEGFSGGEKKKLEVLQLLVLNPTLAILDETDSGLDIDALKTVAQGINSYHTKDNTLLLVTHYKRMLDYIEPDSVIVMQQGRITAQGGVALVEEIEHKGYDAIRKTSK
ncbi:Fe-S cluster assembly ATPase SufC [Candidatus Woesearchaeota archaeon]|nr:Fe-S cluster assembly ATPase SufC [Candidatus Woesearchaeota archaeon]